MAYFRARFRDPAGVLANYDWQVNHTSEEANEQRRQITRTAPTGGVGFVRQQGEASPKIMRFSGAILHQNQLDQMQAYYDACSSRTIFYRDVDGNEHEVIVTAFSPVRQHTARNPKDSSIPLHFWRYTIEMEVVG